jgi:HAD superfamily hydrolase (TIGR01509 family)
VGRAQDATGTAGVTAREPRRRAVGDLPLPEAILWDMDGTLVDTEPYWMRAETELAERHGGAWTADDGLGIVGTSLPYMAQQMRQRAGVPGTDDEIIAVLLDAVIARIERDGVPWRPGVPELLTALRDAHVPCALVTMSYAALAHTVADAAPEGSLRAIVSGDMVCRGKPHPEPYLTAARWLGADIRRCVVFEDSPTGLASAEAAGARVVGVQLFVPLPPAPGRSRLHRVDQVDLDDLRRILAGEVVDLLPG